MPLRGERAGTFGSNGQGETGGGVEPVDELPGEIALALVAVDRHTPMALKIIPSERKPGAFIRKPACVLSTHRAQLADDEIKIGCMRCHAYDTFGKIRYRHRDFPAHELEDQ